MPITIGFGTRTLISAITAVILALVAQHATAQTIQGTASYRERMAMPNGAVFEATLEDVSRADAPALIIAGTRLDSPGNPPIKFSIAYDTARIVANNQYVVRARITQDRKLLFTSDTATPVLTRGNPMSVSIMLRRVTGNQGLAQAPGAAIPLAGTSWQLVKFQGGDEKTLTPDDGAKYTIEFTEGGRLNARIDCNRGSGAWKSGGPNQLQFGPLALTRAMCAAPSMHDQMVKQWENIRSYVIKDGHLFLSLMADGGIYVFQPTK
jgi:uncharacterized lipoprotein YbaY